MADLAGLVERLSTITVLEAAELSKMLEAKWGVSAAAPALAIAIPGVVVPQEAEPEQTEFMVTLKNVDPAKKIAVIKEIRAITGLGLKDAKDFVEGAPRMVRDTLSKADAAKMKAQLEEVGGVVEIA